MTQPIYFSKSLVAASSNILGSITSGASNTAIFTTTLLSSITLDTPRRIQLASSVNVSSGMTFTLTGIIEGGGAKTESFFSSTGAAITTLDYQKITSISVSSTPNIPFTIGTNTTGGTSWRILDYAHGGPVGGTITFSSSSNSMTGSLEWTLDDPGGNWPIIRPGIQFPQPVPWGSSGPLTAATGAVQGLINLEGTLYTPAYAVRLTITSSSSTAGTVYATVLEQGP